MANISPSNKSAANRYDASKDNTDVSAAAQREVANQAKPMAGAIAHDGAAQKATMVEFVTCLVLQGTHTSTVTEVPEWELDVLREIHGPESIVVRSGREVPYPYSAWEAMQYMKNKFRLREDEDVIKRIYPRLKDFAKSTGLPYKAGDDAKSQVQASSVIIHDAGAFEQGAAGSGAGGSAAA